MEVPMYHFSADSDGVPTSTKGLGSYTHWSFFLVLKILCPFFPSSLILDNSVLAKYCLKDFFSSSPSLTFQTCHPNKYSSSAPGTFTIKHTFDFLVAFVTCFASYQHLACHSYRIPQVNPCLLMPAAKNTRSCSSPPLLD